MAVTLACVLVAYRQWVKPEESYGGQGVTNCQGLSMTVTSACVLVAYMQ